MRVEQSFKSIERLKSLECVIYNEDGKNSMICKNCKGIIPKSNEDLDGYCCIACQLAYYKHHSNNPSYRISNYNWKGLKIEKWMK